MKDCKKQRRLEEYPKAYQNPLIELLISNIVIKQVVEEVVTPEEVQRLAWLAIKNRLKSTPWSVLEIIFLLTYQDEHIEYDRENDTDTQK